MRHAQAHTGRAQRPSAGSATSCHEPRIPSIRERRRSICPGASITVCQRAAQGHQSIRFALDTPCADLCFRLRIHLLSLTPLAKAIGLSVQWLQQAQDARRLSGSIRDLMAGRSASLDRLPGGMTEKPNEGGMHPSPSKQTLAAPCDLVIRNLAPIDTRGCDINIWRRRPADTLHLARSMASRNPCPDFETTLPRSTRAQCVQAPRRSTAKFSA